MKWTCIGHFCLLDLLESISFILHNCNKLWLRTVILLSKFLQFTQPGCTLIVHVTCLYFWDNMGIQSRKQQSCPKISTYKHGSFEMKTKVCPVLLGTYNFLSAAIDLFQKPGNAEGWRRTQSNAIGLWINILKGIRRVNQKMTHT